MCKYLNECLIAGDGCQDASSDDCDEYARKEKLSGELCPIMNELGYKQESCQCNIFFVRAVLPASIECRSGDKCICAIITELQPIIQDCLNDKKDRKSIKHHLMKMEKIFSPIYAAKT